MQSYHCNRPKARFKPISPDNSGVDGGGGVNSQVPTYLLCHKYQERFTVNFTVKYEFLDTS